MPMVREHDYQDGKCVHCGDMLADNEASDRSCIAREIPRPVPTSIFTDLGSIGERMREICKEEGETLSGLPLQGSIV